MPVSIVRKLTWTGVFAFNLSATDPISRVTLCGNNPNSVIETQSGTTGDTDTIQPLFWDQLSEWYDNYVVLGSSCSCTPWPGGGTGVNGRVAQVTDMAEYALVPSRRGDLGFYNGIKPYVLGQYPKVKLGRSSLGYTRPKRFRSYCSTASLYGKTKKWVTQDANFQAPTGGSTTDPAADWFWLLIAALPFDNNTMTGSNVYNVVEVRICYYVRLFQRSFLPPS